MDGGLDGMAVGRISWRSASPQQQGGASTPLPFCGQRGGLWTGSRYPRGSVMEITPKPPKPDDGRRPGGLEKFRGTVLLVETDILGAPYQRRVIDLGTDDEGPVVATLVSRAAPTPTHRAVLYVHGYVDYFFQEHLADFYGSRGFDFYALDLRKYGRSLMPYQTPNFVRSISEYFP